MGVIILMDYPLLRYEQYGPSFRAFPIVKDDGLYCNISHPESRSLAGRVVAEYYRVKSFLYFLAAMESTLTALQIPPKIEFEKRNYSFDGKTTSHGVLVKFSLFEDHIRIAMRHRRKLSEYIDFEKHVMPIVCGLDQSSPQMPDYRCIMLRMHRWMTVAIYGDPVKRFQLNFDLLYPSTSVFSVVSLSKVVQFLGQCLAQIKPHYEIAKAYAWDREKEELALKYKLFEKIKVI